MAKLFQTVFSISLFLQFTLFQNVFADSENNPHIHAHLMHLDGFRADLFKELLKMNRLPNFKKLLNRGRISYKASTVDKSETMKVIQSYLTSRIDTKVTGWWEFDREKFRFRNYWMDPFEVINFAIGTRFPTAPTVYDIIRMSGNSSLAGFSLHRRGVDFNRYGRAYVEGINGVFSHLYLDQAHASMTSLIEKIDMALSDQSKPFPIFSSSLLAPADEYSHLLGVTEKDKSKVLHCIDFSNREEDSKVIDQLNSIFKGTPSMKRDIYFETSVTYQSQFEKVCLRLPRLKVDTERGEDYRPANPHYVLGMLIVDFELGRLIDKLKSIRTEKGNLFENTLFVMMGDHGMVDSPNKMSVPDKRHKDSFRSEKSYPTTFIRLLNKELKLESTRPGSRVLGLRRLGIDDTEQPIEITKPFKYMNWNRYLEKDEVREVQRAIKKAEEAAIKIVDEFRSNIMVPVAKRKYSILSYSDFIADKVVGVLLWWTGMGVEAVDTFTKLYLYGEERYLSLEKKALSGFYDEFVGLIYGGAARNNAELFLPHKIENGKNTWRERPTFERDLKEKIFGSANLGDSHLNGELFNAIKSIKGTSLIFVRMNGHKSHFESLNKKTEILVIDMDGQHGKITVDETGDEPKYSYKVLTLNDPLNYGDKLPNGEGYRKWNDYSVDNDHLYHNAVAGMGSYLASNNAAIGDVTLMHSKNWNYGGNSAGHGGLLRGEKLTLMLVSGPNIKPNGRPLFTKNSDNTYSHPIVVDAAPSILRFLGFKNNILEETMAKGRDEFVRYWERWNQSQKIDCANDFLALLQSIGEGFIDNLDKKSFDKIRRNLDQEFNALCRAVPIKVPFESKIRMIQRMNKSIDGRELEL